jgi:hypothetical protein
MTCNFFVNCAVGKRLMQKMKTSCYRETGSARWLISDNGSLLFEQNLTIARPVLTLKKRR